MHLLVPIKAHWCAVWVIGGWCKRVNTLLWAVELGWHGGLLPQFLGDICCKDLDSGHTLPDHPLQGFLWGQALEA